MIKSHWSYSAKLISWLASSWDYKRVFQHTLIIETPFLDPIFSSRTTLNVFTALQSFSNSLIWEQFNGDFKPAIFFLYLLCPFTPQFLLCNAPPSNIFQSVLSLGNTEWNRKFWICIPGIHTFYKLKYSLGGLIFNASLYPLVTHLNWGYSKISPLSRKVRWKMETSKVKVRYIQILLNP